MTGIFHRRLVTTACFVLAAATSASASGGGGMGATMSYAMILPFAGLLLCIAILPLAASHWFEHNRNKAIVAAIFGLPVLVYLVAAYGSEGTGVILHTAEEYVSFICLLAALYTVAGGVYVTGNLLGTPLTNVGFFVVGAILANFIGTTGAAMVLIRPLLRANSSRKYQSHVVIFFIFTVCNCGGLLTPLGDPPLFLGFLRGVDFFWTLRLHNEWLVVNGLVIAAYLLFETYFYRKESLKAIHEDMEMYVPFTVAGKRNAFFLAGIIGAVLFSEPLLAVGEMIHFPFLREVIMLAMLGLSLKLGPSGPRAANKFTWAPIVEVAVLFAGIFAAMIPALEILAARGSELHLTQPWQFYWASGLLSSFLDNAPTYLTFGSAAQGFLHIPPEEGFKALMSDEIVAAIGRSPAEFLAAVSCGSVMMGANSYIGNAPNFMVKAIAEENDVKMPSFFGYMAYSGAVLFPVFILVTYIFFR
jgi:Na+/H+ antiporter NhaD/arsenite permease-like protein